MIDLSGKTALITGSAQGIGRGCALKLSSAGAKVILNDLPDNEKLIETNHLIKKSGGDSQMVTADVFDLDRQAIFLEKVLKKSGNKLDIFVSNPYKSIQKPLLEWTADELQEILNAVLISHLNLARLVAKQMVSSKTKGKIIFISSLCATMNRENSLGYDCSKAGINRATAVFALELAKYKINVNAIAPGLTITPGEKKFATDEELSEAGADIPLGRACQPEEIGNVAAFLVSDLAEMITGQVLTVDAGMSLVDFTYNKPSLTRP